MSRSLEKSQIYQASIKYWAIIGLPAKHHISLAGWWWPVLVVFRSTLLSSTKKKNLSELDPFWQNFLDPRMRRVVVSYKRKYVLEALLNCLVKLAKEKKCGKVNWPLGMTIAVDWEVKAQTKQNFRPVEEQSALGHFRTILIYINFYYCYYF